MITFKRLLFVISWPFLFIGANLYLYAMLLLGLLPHVQVKKGESFLVLEDMPISGLTHWLAPATFGFKCTIPQGTILVALDDSERISLGFACIPQDRSAFEQQFVPEEDRTDSKYAGYSFVIKYKEIGKRLKRIA